MICLGLDWAEDHHDIAVMSETGELLAEFRVEESMDGVERIHAAVAPHIADPADVVVGTESAHSLVAQALVAAGYAVFEINPLASSRYRDRHHLSGAKSDRGDAKMLADVVRTDRHNHREYVGSSDLSEAIKVLARAHQSLIHQRQTQINALRSALRQYYPALLLAFPNLARPRSRDSSDVMALIERAPTPAQGRTLSRLQIASALRKAGRQRGIERRAEEIRKVLGGPHLAAPPVVTNAYGNSARATARVIVSMTIQIGELAQEMNSRFEEHPDAKILHSLPGLGPILGARVLGEFGDAPNYYTDTRARKNYATTSPVTRASGKLRVVNARHGGNRHLGESCLRWAFCAVRSSPGVQHYYEALRGRDKTHSQAIRSVANRLVGILHGCLEHGVLYDEAIAWPQSSAAESVAA
ncbi:MAG: IS110 family transposase [Candidatus Dormibacteraeota bacterium]|uniref:IS110 family transposase n=1 Tax=Candidatus Aeolococcus gillhamiae TaxID=3127015 RepID=A0A934N4L2_9BACT|nr:IS110 family transposase [Candidatus Dormibacteraeota bacterium]